MSLTNEDLAPVPAERRTWNTWNYAALWIGMSICIPTYQLSSGLIAGGMNWYQAILAVLLGNLIVLVPMVLNGHAGARYGIPFPVLARASFGTRGANVPAILRAFVACGWFGIQVWIGGVALAVVAERTVWPGVMKSAWVDEVLGTAEHGPVSYTGKVPDPTTKVTVNGAVAVVDSEGAFTVSVARDAEHCLSIATVTSMGVATQGQPFHRPAGAFDVRTGVFACFLLFWLVNMAVVWARIEVIKKLLVVKSVFLPLATLALLWWAIASVEGVGPVLSKPSTYATTTDFLVAFFPAVTAMVGFWATLSLNIPDFTRYATSQKAQMTGQALGLPTSMTAVAFVGAVVTSATAILPAFGGNPEWDPTKVVSHFGSDWTVAFAMFCVVVSTLATNIAANIVSPANDFANLAPDKIGFRAGGFITGVFGILMFPWMLLQSPSGYIFSWLIGYSALLGPIGGIMIADYFLIRRQELVVDELYRHDGRYGFKDGWNPIALVALVLGIIPCLPGFLVQVGALSAPDPHTGSLLLRALIGLYSFAWFVGFGIAGAVYYYGMRTRPSK